MATLAKLRETARDRVAEYTDPTKAYAFRTYDVAPQNQSDRLSAEDILAANLLSLRLTWQHVTPLFAVGDGPPQRLLACLNDALATSRLAPKFEEIAPEDELESVFGTLAAANEATKGVAGWSPVTVSKVLHRHAPHVIPIVDSRVRAFYEVRAGQEGELRRRLWRDITANIDWLTEIGQDFRTSDGRALSTLRLADILIWTPTPEVAPNDSR